MARPKKEESIRRTSNVMVRFSSIEYELVAGYAKDAGYPISTFVRKQALSEKVAVNYNIVADIGEIQNLTAQAAGIGNNLNQIAAKAHTLNALDVQRYDENCRKLDEAIKTITAAVILPRPMK